MFLQSALSGEKKECEHFSFFFSFSRKKRDTFGGEPPSSVGRLGRPRGLASAPWWLPTLDLRSTLGHRSVNLEGFPSHLGASLAHFR